MNLTTIVSEGAFNSYGINDNKKYIPSNFLLSNQQKERIKQRNQLATQRHITTNITTKNLTAEEKLETSNSIEKKKIKNINNLQYLNGQTKQRNLKQKELAVKLEYLKKLQAKEEEVRNKSLTPPPLSIDK